MVNASYLFLGRKKKSSRLFIISKAAKTKVVGVEFTTLKLLMGEGYMCL